MSEPFPPADCTGCGRCWFSENPLHVRVFSVDRERMSGPSLRFVRETPEGSAMDMAGGHCAALRVDERGRLVCAIYAERPDVCRSLVRGSSGCKDQFDRKRGRPDVLLGSLRR